MPQYPKAGHTARFGRTQRREEAQRPIFTPNELSTGQSATFHTASATPGRPVGQILQEQLNNNPVNSALMPEIRVVIAKLEARNRVDPELLSPAIRQLFRTEIQPFMIDWFSHDPTEIAQHWKGPTLIIQGDADIQVKRLDVEMLDAALTNAEAVILPNATHVLKADVPHKPFATYTDPSLPLHPELITQIVNFLAQHPSQ